MGGGWWVGEINNIDHLSPVKAEIGPELGKNIKFREENKIFLAKRQKRNLFLAHPLVGLFLGFGWSSKLFRAILK